MEAETEGNHGVRTELDRMGLLPDAAANQVHHFHLPVSQQCADTSYYFDQCASGASLGSVPDGFTAHDLHSLPQQTPDQLPLYMYSSACPRTMQIQQSDHQATSPTGYTSPQLSQSMTTNMTYTWSAGAQYWSYRQQSYDHLQQQSPMPYQGYDAMSEAYSQDYQAGTAALPMPAHLQYEQLPSSRSVTPAESDFSAVAGASRSHTPVDDGGEAYAHLLFKCLRDAPDHKLPLKDIYVWMVDNCSRARNATDKGWQNSVRHNLSMNKGFEKEELSDSTTSKKGAMWKLTKEALARGSVYSTTQYRNKSKRASTRARQHTPAAKRVQSGSKGGQASSRAAKRRASRQAEAASTQAAVIEQPLPPYHPAEAIQEHGTPVFGPSADMLASPAQDSVGFSTPSSVMTPQQHAYPHFFSAQTFTSRSVSPLEYSTSFEFNDMSRPIPRSDQAGFVMSPPFEYATGGADQDFKELFPGQSWSF